MADGGGWWGSLSGVVSAAKNKSAEVLEFVKRDLDELSSTVKNEASQVVNSTTSVLKEQLSFDQPESTVNTMKRSMSSFLGTVNNVLNPSPDDSDTEAMVMRGNIPVVLSRFQAQLHSLMTTEETFTVEPSDAEAAQFSAWLEIQDDILNHDNLTKLMVTHTELHVEYTKLVPSKVSHADFWQRFLFRRALLEDEEARRQSQERRQQREAQEAENFLSSHDEEFSSNVDISDEDQMRLLQEYENECKTKTSNENLATDKDNSQPSSPQKLPLDENHYSDGKPLETEGVSPTSDKEDLEKSLITDAKNKLFSFVKTAIDSLDLLENDYETEESSISSYEKCPKSGENIESNVGSSENLKITMKEKGDMVVLGNGASDDADTGPEDSTVISSSSSSSATLPDDEWEKLQAVEDGDSLN